MQGEEDPELALTEPVDADEQHMLYAAGPGLPLPALRLCFLRIRRNPREERRRERSLGESPNETCHPSLYGERP